MRSGAIVMLFAACCAMTLRAAGGVLEQLDSALSVHSDDGVFRARLSGTVDLEAYDFTQPAPGLIETRDDTLWNPRLTAFLDAQVGVALYAFVQARVDRGFDPSDEALGSRVDEYAVRITPWSDGRLSLQVGKFATVVGNWVQRHGSWENPFVTAPLVYENLTGIWDASAATTSGTLLAWAHVLPRPTVAVPVTDKYLRLPVVWGPSYAKGVAVSGQLGRFTYAGELKNASLSSRPATWAEESLFNDHVTLSGRLGYRPNPMWDLGLSCSDGAYLKASAASSLPAQRRFKDYRQRVVAQDVSFAWHRVQVWAEFFEASFKIPGVGDADTFSYYVESRYKFTPRLAGAIRWNEQTFSTIAHGAGNKVKWGSDVRRLDTSLTYRFSTETELKCEYSVQQQDLGAKKQGRLLAAQIVVRF
jgi:hypothetical protein